MPRYSVQSFRNCCFILLTRLKLKLACIDGSQERSGLLLRSFAQSEYNCNLSTVLLGYSIITPVHPFHALQKI